MQKPHGKNYADFYDWLYYIIINTYFIKIRDLHKYFLTVCSVKRTHFHVNIFIGFCFILWHFAHMAMSPHYEDGSFCLRKNFRNPLYIKAFQLRQIVWRAGGHRFKSCNDHQIKSISNRLEKRGGNYFLCIEFMVRYWRKKQAVHYEPPVSFFIQL